MNIKIIYLFLINFVFSQHINEIKIDTLKLKNELNQFYKNSRLASLSFAIFQGQNFKKNFVLGYQNLTKRERATDKTYYALASVTKPITASLMIQAVDSGLIQYSDFVSNYIDSFPKDITIRDLLVHDSGIQRNKNYAKLLSADSLADILDFIPEVISKKKKFKYTNLNYSFLGHILEEIYQKPFNEIVNTYFMKTSQKNSVHFLTNIPDSISTANAYVLKGRKRYPHKFFISDIWEPAALGLATSEGLINFLRFHMNQEYISKVLNYPVFVKSRWSHNGASKDERYGYGFRLIFIENQLETIYHNGFMYGALSSLYYLPEYDIGFVALTNTSGYPKQKINFSSQILRLVKRSIKDRSKLNEANQNMKKIKRY